MTPDLGKMLIISGVVLLVFGFLYTFLSNAQLPKLPGDTVIKRGNSTFYFPIVTSILLSIILSLIVNFYLRK